jgi:heme O synthase-like polyprenyltransferase
MAAESIPVALDVAVVQGVHTHSSVLSDYWMLTKPEINLLIGITTGAAFCMGSRAPFVHFPWVLLLHTLVGTVLAVRPTCAISAFGT